MALFNKEPDRNARPQQVPTPPSNHTEKGPTALAPEMKAAPAPTPAAPRPAAPTATDARAYLDSGSKVNGKLYFDTPARVDGQVEGEITAKEALMVGETAIITAQIKAASVVVAGKVSGDITASHRIEIRPSAKVLGNVTAPILVIQEGALFEGHCAMQSDAHDDRKVTVFPKEERLAQAAGQKPA
jgi:cytoskeletal protein CcmA (bactofilin family)